MCSNSPAMVSSWIGFYRKGTMAIEVTVGEFDMCSVDDIIFLSY